MPPAASAQSMEGLRDLPSVFGCTEPAQFRTLAGELHAFLTRYKWLHSYRFVEYFTQGCGSDIPEAWHAYCAGLDEAQLRNLAHCDGGGGDAAIPADLRDFLQACKKFSMQNRASLSSEHVRVKCDGVLKRNLTVKKQHEVERMSALIDSVHPGGEGCGCVVDVGCGQGYLPTMLSYGLGKRVVAIEAAEKNVEKAVERAKIISMAKQVCRKRKNPGDDAAEGEAEAGVPEVAEPANEVSYVPVYLTPSTTDEEVASLLASCGVDEAQQAAGVCLTGLHACGDLTPMLVNLFTTSTKFSSLAVVGCCYYKMGWPAPKGFPMSAFYRDETRAAKDLIGPVSAQMACENCRKWFEMSDAEWTQLKRLSLNRSLLEVVMHKCYPDVKELIGVKTVSRTMAKAEFADYAEYCLKRLKMRRMDLSKLGAPADGGGFGPEEAAAAVPPPAVPHPSKEELVAMQAEYLKKLPLFLVWLTLRECIAPALEMFFILDRYLHMQECLSEQGSATRYAMKVCTIFDNTVSPRNVAIVAVKQPPSHTAEGTG